MKEITLPSGKKAEIAEFKGSHVKEAMKAVQADGNPYDIVFHIIAMLVKIDGQPIFAQDIDEMSGADALLLVGEFSGDNFR